MQENDCLLRTARVEFAEGTPLGIRQIASSVSSLRVTAGPMEALDRVLHLAGHPTFMAYVLKGDVTYVGHGCGTRRLGDRLEQQDLDGVRQVYVVHSDAISFGKQAARTLERMLWDAASQNAVQLANRARPTGVGPDDLSSAESRELARVARSLLWCAGCTIFEEPQERSGLHDGDVVVPPSGVRILAPDALPQPEGSFLRLSCGGVEAEGFKTSVGFVVLPGSQFHMTDRKGLDPNNARRRDEIRRLAPFSPMATSATVASLTAGVLCISDAMAAKLVTGSHRGSNAWKPAPKKL